MDLDSYLNDLPLLHTWNLGETWNTGGFDAQQLGRIHQIIGERFPGRRVRVLETGAGNSTITFLHLPPEQLVTIAPAADLRDRILEYCADHSIVTSTLDYRVGRSEVELPAMAFGAGPATSTDQLPKFDVVLIDGGHGWPTVFVDFCYANVMMRQGSVLLLDDTQIHSVAELSRLLEMQPGFTLLEQIRKLQVWEKDDDQAFLPEHSREPYIIEMTRKAQAVHHSLPHRVRRKISKLMG